MTAIPNAWPMLIAAINHAFPYPILVITSRPDTARHLYDQINPWCPEFGCLLFPEPDTLPGERLAADPATVQGRLKVLFSLVNHLGKRSYKSNLIVISSSYALAQKTIPRKVFDSSCHVIRAGAKVNLPEILKKWTSLGYEFERVVELPGTFSRRGGIIDIYPHVSPYPVRMELEGNLVESLRFFDPASQRSLEITEEVFIGPAVEMVITAEHTLPDGLKSLDPGKKSADMAFYASLFNTGTLFDYLPENSLVISEPALMLEKSVNEIHAEAEKVRREQVETGELPGDFPLPCLSWPDFDRLLHSVSPSIELCRPEEETWSPENRIFFDFQAAPSYGGQLHSCIGDIARFKKNGRHIIIASHQARRLSELLEEQDIIAGVTTDLKVIPAAGDVALVQGMLDGGWTFQSGKGENYVLFTDKEIFGFVKQRREVKRRPAKRQLFLSEVEPGNYVVHADHGIALFKGTTVIQSEGIDREYVILEYAEGDKLYVPADQAGHVTRYVGASDHAPRLNRLGTQEW
ncbi:MAG: CarD family transcriptional regulator, partial [Dehalococcoidia bacterium]|nr:CarD family transcriptional regulator [Dehalococcoidia bacterium]